MRDGSEQLPETIADAAADQLVDATGNAREAVLEKLIAQHPRYAAALRRLHAELSGAERLLAGSYPGLDDEAPTQIGGHRVVRRLGEGAFGIVFLCDQQQPVVRQVAIKVLRPGAGDARTLRRFGAERQLLAQLNHPAITQVFDAGALPDGRPYFVMEYVEGSTFLQYCQRRGLSCQDRLRLFVELCRGVAHAHNRGIVHRDLKPGNVLVVDGESGPLPKIIDFGIAKAIDVELVGDGPRTDPGRVIGTPGYMSPEQASGRVDEIDERTDVFALGVMLYELLTDTLPWNRGAAATDSEPMRPSARVGTASTTAATAVSQPRRRLAAELRGDLDWITLKALMRERGERYATVMQLANDIERHLRGETVSVGPPSTSYRLRKFVRRNRGMVTAVGVAALLLGVGAVAALQYGSAADAAVDEARRDAESSSADATAVVEQLLVRANDASMREVPRGDGAREQLLQDALSFYDRFLRNRPESAELRAGRCKTLLSLAHVHWLLDQPEAVGRTTAEALTEARALTAAAPQDLQYRALLGDALQLHGHAFAVARNHKAAQPEFAAAVAALEPCAAADPRRYGRAHAVALRDAAITLPPHLHEQRLAGLRACLQAIEQLQQLEPPLVGVVDDHVQACIYMAQELQATRELEAADAMLATAAAEIPRVSANRLQVQVQVLRQQGIVAWELRQRPLALQRGQSAVEAAVAWQQQQPDRMLPREYLAKAHSALASMRNYTDDFAGAETSFRLALATAEATAQRFPDAGRLVELCSLQRQFARILFDRFRRQDLAEAAQHAAAATATNDRIPGDVDSGRQPRWQLLAMQASIDDALGADAAPLWQQVEAALPSDATLRARADQDLLVEACSGLARSHFAAGRSAAAADWLQVAQEIVERNKPDANKALVDIGWLAARIAAATGDHATAAAWADRIVAARGTWFGTRRAADCLRLAWHCAAAAAPAVDAGVGAAYRQRAVALYERVIATLRQDIVDTPDDPFYVLPWGFACIGAADCKAADGDAAAARELLAPALPKLAAVRAAAHCDVWEESAFVEGQQLLQRLDAAARR